MGAITVGVLALQGGVREHVRLLESLDVRAVLVRTPSDLSGPDGLRVNALVLPGGESSTIGRLLRLFDLVDPLREAIRDGLPTLGTCAGLVLLADRVLDPAPGQQSLGVLDVTVRRNAFGPQVDSAEVDLATTDGPARVAFIRAPVVVETGPEVEIIARREGAVVGVSQGGITGLSFHPELTGESLFHRRLLRSAWGNTDLHVIPGSDPGSQTGEIPDDDRHAAISGGKGGVLTSGEEQIRSGMTVEGR